MKTSRLYTALERWLLAHGRVAVAFSGGVDSAFLLAVAARTNGVEVKALTGVGPQFPHEETVRARHFCQQFAVEQIELPIAPAEIAAFAENDTDRCYHCKRHIFGALLTRIEPGWLLVDGSQCDDADEYRPGRQALKELKIRSPLAECGFRKTDIRDQSRRLQLETAALPSCACLVTRIPYGERVTAERLKRIDKAEQALHQLGFRQLRVRDYGARARLELDSDGLERLRSDAALSLAVEKALRSSGYVETEIDPSGYRTGSMLSSQADANG